MKALKHSLMIFVFFILLPLWQDRSYAGEQNVTYLGEFCIVLDDPILAFRPNVGDILLRLGVLSYGNGHYILRDQTNYLGSAFIRVDNKVEISLQRSYPPDGSYEHYIPGQGNLGGTAFVTIVIDELSKLTGYYTLWGFEFSFNESNQTVEATSWAFRARTTPNSAWITACP
ncbi:MAG: hypothetical protein AB1390_04055 [Nitrospirota bacterium]